MTKEEALYKVKGYLTDIIPTEDYSEVEDIMAALEQEPCEDAISRQAVLDVIDRELFKWDVIDEIRKLPTVNPQPKTGHWIYDDDCHEHGHCSECGYGSVDLVNGEPHNFCRRCGARMVEPQKNEGNE